MRKLILTALVFLPFVFGCQRPAASSAPASTPVPGSAAAPSDAGAATGTPSAAPGSPAPEWREVTVPAGTLLPIRLEESVSSDRSRVEEAVSATLVRDVVVHGVTAVPAGSLVSGTVTEARRSGRVKGVAQLAIRFDTVKPAEGDNLRVRTSTVSRRAPTTRRKDALKIGVPAAGGAIVGGLLGGKKGALVGGGVGGGAGTAVVLSTRGKEVRLPRGTRLSIRLLEPVTVRIPA